MAVKVNGAKLEWYSYEFARVVKGEVAETGDIDVLQARQKALGLPGRIMFRATYVTDWMAAKQ